MKFVLSIWKLSLDFVVGAGKYKRTIKAEASAPSMAENPESTMMPTLPTDAVEAPNSIMAPTHPDYQDVDFGISYQVQVQTYEEEPPAALAEAHGFGLNEPCDRQHDEYKSAQHEVFRQNKNHREHFHQHVNQQEAAAKQCVTHHAGANNNAQQNEHYILNEDVYQQRSVQPIEYRNARQHAEENFGGQYDNCGLYLEENEHIDRV